MINNAKRTFISMLKEIASEENIRLITFSYDWMGVLEKDGKRGAFWGYQLPENRAGAHLIAKDKSATYELLTKSGVPAVPHFLFITPEEFAFLGVQSNWDGIYALLEKYGKIVLKPNEGTGGESVLLAKTKGETELAAGRIFQKYRTLAVSPYLDIQAEYRVVVSGEKVKLTFSKRRPAVVGDGKRNVFALAAEKYRNAELTTDGAYVPKEGEEVLLTWHHNLGKGGYAERVTDNAVLEKLTPLALSAAKAMGLDLCSVDIVFSEGKYAVLEINSGVMTEFFARESEENYQTAKEIYREAILRYFEK